MIKLPTFDKVDVKKIIAAVRAYNPDTHSHFLTTLDFLKAAALILMIIDHLGFYFFTGDPLNDWLRAIGRLSAPIWFFLVGYARSRDLSKDLWIAGFILLAANIVTGMFIFPLNNLFTILFVRLMLDVIAPSFFAKRENTIAGMLIMIILCLPTGNITEYGSMGLLLALMGYAVRHQYKKTNLLSDPVYMQRFYWAGAGAYILSQLATFNLTFWPSMFMVLGCLGVFYALLHAHMGTHPYTTQRLPKFAVKGIKLMGRRTLEFYVIHLILFKLIACAFGLGFPIYGWFDWDWTGGESFAHLYE